MVINELEKKIQDGKGTFKDASDIAGEFGKTATSEIAKQFKESFPDGSISEEEVRKIVSPIMRKNHDYISNMTCLVIEAMYKKTGVGLKAVVPEYNIQRENDLVKEISERSFMDEFINDELGNKVETSARKTVDDSIKFNAENANGSGLEVRVSREYDGVGLSNNRVCQWCLERQGNNMTLQEAYEKGAFQRHDGCGCLIEYTSKKGEKTYQTGKSGPNDWLSEEEFQKRVNYGLGGRTPTPQERINAAIEMQVKDRRK